MAAKRKPFTARVCLVAQAALDLDAYGLLFERRLSIKVAAESDFRATSLWNAMRSEPQYVFVIADTASAVVQEALQMIARLRPAAQIVAVSAAFDPEQIEAWGRCPLNGYIVKDGGVEEFLAALDNLRAGHDYYSSGVRSVLDRCAQRQDGLRRLSGREAELLPLLARGMTLREAAEKLEIGYKTADSYRTSLLRKLGLHDRVQLARYAIRQRIIDP